jgi:CHASE2 domain-containing sensor protein
MHDVLISHLEEDSTLALKVALALESAGFSTCEQALGERANADDTDAAERAIHIRLVDDRDYDVTVGRSAAPTRISTNERTVRVTGADARHIAEQLSDELLAKGRVPATPRAARIAELEAELARRSGSATETSKDQELATPQQPASFSWPRFLALTVYFAAIGLLLLNADPFGMSALSSKYSQDLLNQVFGSWYPADARDESTVVLLTDTGLESQREPWPASYRLHARILNAILAYGPKAVMVDIWFHDSRVDPSLAQLERALQRYRDREIPVYAAANLAWPEDGGIREEIAQLVTPVPVPKVADQQDRANRRYPLVVSQSIAGSSESAALRIYREVVRPPIAPAPHGVEGQAYSEEDWRVAFGDPMEVLWGTTSAPINEKSVYCSFDSDPLSVVQARILGGDGVKSDCPYAPTLLAADLLTRSGDDDVATLIADRVVFYGAYLAGVPDLLYPPTHLPIAGVYLHPMALDNLMTFGDDYIRRAEAGGTRYAAAWGLIAGLPLALATLIGYAAFVLLSLAPLNWIGHLSIGGTLAAHPYERHLALLRRLGVGGFLPR